MKKNNRIFLFLCMVCIFVCLLTGCGASSPLIGTWTPAGRDSAPSGYPDYMILDEDGVCTVDGATGVWSEDSGVLTIRASNGLFSAVRSYNYELNGSTLTLVDVDDDPNDAIIYDKSN